MSAHHGKTPAAWTGSAIALIGFLVGGVGTVLAQVWLFVVGAALLVLALIVGKVMQMMGLGQSPRAAESSGEQRSLSHSGSR